MVMMDRWMVTIILAATLRFFDIVTQQTVLMGHVVGLMLYLNVLTAVPGDLMEADARASSGVGTFCMILTAIVGVI